MKKWHKTLIIGALLPIAAFIGMVIHGLWLYASADYCRSSATNSRVCVARSESIVVRQISRDISDPNEKPDILRGVVLNYKSGTCELWLRDMPSNLVPQASVSLLRWNGRCIGIEKEKGIKQYSYYWEPGVMVFFATWILSTLALYAPLLLRRKHNDAATTAGLGYRLCLVVTTFLSAIWVVLLLYANVGMGFL